MTSTEVSIRFFERHLKEDILKYGERQAIHMAIAALREQPRWISVEERLPENEKEVLICAKRKHYFEPEKYIRVVLKAFFTDGKHNTEQTGFTWSTDYMDMEYDEENDAYIIPEGWWECVEYGEEFTAVSDFVTHWMPLPEPPKEEV